MNQKASTKYIQCQWSDSTVLVVGQSRRTKQGLGLTKWTRHTIQVAYRSNQATLVRELVWVWRPGASRVARLALVRPVAQQPGWLNVDAKWHCLVTGFCLCGTRCVIHDIIRIDDFGFIRHVPTTSLETLVQPVYRRYMIYPCTLLLSYWELYTSSPRSCDLGIGVPSSCIRPIRH